MENSFIKYLGTFESWELLIYSAILGTAFAYLQKYAYARPKPASLGIYLFGDAQSVVRALIKLVGALSVALVVDMQTGMSVTAILTLGVGIGLAIPVQIEAEEIKRLNERKQKQNEPLPKTEFKP